MRLSLSDDMGTAYQQLTLTMFAAEPDYVFRQLTRGKWRYQNKKTPLESLAD
ncbi:hypothetical protein [Acinetobacter venetianus]|uniref:hypothetical protein n=1 Tax=Acinetobacter venetianus TaxID=52133 RepID=UPI00241C90B1|nr:hypothetical protein [Acinetobacter venetianus]